MADEEPKPGRSRFLSRAKWTKSPKIEEPKQPKQDDAFKLNEDVVDFLKPSTDRATSIRPRIDIAVAKRFPGANDITAFEQPTEDAQDLDVNGLRKTRRREGLSVGFVKTAPDIIGEGGDESPYPPSEIGRMRAMASRSKSFKKPPSFDSGMGRGGEEPPGPLHTVSRTQAEEFAPGPLRRANTSHNELSPPLERRLDDPYRRDRSPSFSKIDAAAAQSAGYNIKASPFLERHQSPQFQASGGDDARANNRSPGDPMSINVKKRSEMAANEGMAFRRASALFVEADDDEGENENDPPPHFGGPPGITGHTLPVLQGPVFPAAPHNVPQPGSNRLVPESAAVPPSRSPFADPKYIQRHASQDGPAPRPPQPQVTYSRPQPAAEPRAAQGLAIYHQQRSTSDNSTISEHTTGTFPTGLTSHATHAQPLQKDRDRSPLRDLALRMRESDMDESESHAIEGGSRTNSSHLAPPGEHNVFVARSDDRFTDNRVHEPAPQSHHGSPNLSAEHQVQSHALQPASRSPLARGPSPNDFRQQKPPPLGPSRSPANFVRQAESPRPGSSGSARSFSRPFASPQVSPNVNSELDAALADFIARVAHMKGVFRLTAEKEMPVGRCTPVGWLRAAYWWYLRGKNDLEISLHQRGHSPALSVREVLTQGHVDMAKACWMLSEPLQEYEYNGHHFQPNSLQAIVQSGCSLLRSQLKSFLLSVGRSRLMPPTQSLIQGQDTRIWLQYPRFTADAASALSGSTGPSLIIDTATSSPEPIQVLPLGDTRDDFCYGRFPAEVSLATDQQETDRVILPCILSVLRGCRDYQNTLVIASQTELVNIRVGPKGGPTGGLTWHDVSWRASSQSLTIRLRRDFSMNVRLHERDYRSVWNMAEHARRVDHSLRAEDDEMLIQDVQLAEIQYADSSNPTAFPQDKVRDCRALVYERHMEERGNSGIRKVHGGYRLLLITNPSNRTQSCATHDIGGHGPLMFEFMTDPAAQGTTAMVIRLREERRQCRMLLVFHDGNSRQDLYDVLNGLNIGPEEDIIGKMALEAMSIETAMSGAQSPGTAHSPLSSFQWQKLGVTSSRSNDANSRLPATVHSEHLRIVARHTLGCITDRLNLGKGELLLRLPCQDRPQVQILREPQHDLSMSIDTRNAPPNVPDAISHLLSSAQRQATMRTFTFASPTDLHNFQAAITGYTVRFDGLASTFGISRRMMVVPIYHKYTATNVRLQVVANAHNTVIQLAVFMENFEHADAMCFQIKSTDVFERIKGDSKGKKWAVKMVDAKFSLPKSAHEDKDGEAKFRSRFVNLEGLEYAEEHDDITIGFDTEQARDSFAQALPAATTVGRAITLMRRI